MPNTLGHLALQGLATRAFDRAADLRWIALGSVLPDLPWIVQRALAPIVPDAWRLDLRAYAIAQASFASCLVLAAAAALGSRRPARTFGVLGLNVAVHLVADALQSTWADGVHFLAPFSWRASAWGVFWPESPASVAVTFAGIVWIAHAWWRAPGSEVPVARPSGRRFAAAAALATLWVAAPFVSRGGPEAADHASIHGLRHPEARPGRAVELDRVPYEPRGTDEGVVVAFTGERLAVVGALPGRGARLSLRGRFRDRGTIQVLEWHAHWPVYRDLASYAGLSLVAFVWGVRPLPWRTGRGTA